jgi:presequence protease
MGIYLDSVFDPLNREVDFLEESWRLEFSDINNLKSGFQYKGYAYSEMQKNFQVPDFIFLEKAREKLFKGTHLEHVSGGTPDQLKKLQFPEII